MIQLEETHGHPNLCESLNINSSTSMASCVVSKQHYCSWFKIHHWILMQVKSSSICSASVVLKQNMASEIYSWLIHIHSMWSRVIDEWRVCDGNFWELAESGNTKWFSVLYVIVKACVDDGNLNVENTLQHYRSHIYHWSKYSSTKWKGTIVSEFWIFNEEFKSRAIVAHCTFFWNNL